MDGEGGRDECSRSHGSAPNHEQAGRTPGIIQSTRGAILADKGSCDHSHKFHSAWGRTQTLYGVRRNLLHHLDSPPRHTLQLHRHVRRDVCNNSAPNVQQVDSLSRRYSLPNYDSLYSRGIEGQEVTHEDLSWGIQTPERPIKGTDVKFTEAETANVVGSNTKFALPKQPQSAMAIPKSPSRSIRDSEADISHLRLPHGETPGSQQTMQKSPGGLRRGSHTYDYLDDRVLPRDYNSSISNICRTGRTLSARASMPNLYYSISRPHPGPKDYSVVCSSQGHQTMVDLSNPWNNEIHVPVQLLENPSGFEDATATWEQLISGGWIQAVPNVPDAVKLWKDDILENFGLHAEEPFYQHGESIICRCLEGFFMFATMEFGHARLLVQNDTTVLYQILAGNGEGGRFYKNKVWSNEDLRTQDVETWLAIMLGEPVNGALPQGKWREAGEPYNAQGEDQLGSNFD